MNSDIEIENPFFNKTPVIRYLNFMRDPIDIEAVCNTQRINRM